MTVTDLPVAADSFTQTERVQSLIPVRPWQDGLSYYNNYSSKNPGAGGPKPVREIERAETVTLDEQRGVERYRNPSSWDRVDLAETTARGGTSGKLASDAFTVTATLSERHGVWALPARGEPVALNEARVLNGRQNFLRTDAVTATEFAPPFKFDWTDAVSLSETGRQSGLRARVVRDDLYAVDYRLALEGRRSMAAQDTFTASETGTQRGTRAWTGSDPAQLTEGTTRSGTRVIALQSDDFSLADTGYQRGGLRQQLASDPLSVTETGVQSGRRDFTRTDPLTVGEAHASRNATPLRSDTVALADAGQARVVGATRSDPVGVRETGTLSRAALGRADTVTLAERAGSDRDLLRRDDLLSSDTGLSSSVQFARTDTATLTETRFAERDDRRTDEAQLTESGRLTSRTVQGGEDTQVTDSGRLVTRPVQGSDTARLAEAALLRPTRPVWASEDTQLAESGRQSGTRAYRTQDAGALLELTSILRISPRAAQDTLTLTDALSGPAGRRSFTVTDTLTVTETVPAFRFDWRDPVTMQDAGAVYVVQRSIDAADSARVQDSGTLLNLTPRQGDFVGLHDTGARRVSAFVTRDTLTLQDAHSVTRPRWAPVASDGARLASTSVKGFTTLTLGDAVTLTAAGEQRGLRAWSFTDTLELLDAGEQREGSPKRTDPLSAEDRHLGVHGRRSFTASDTVTGSEAYQRGGRTGKAAWEMVLARETFEYPPRNVTAEDAVGVNERFFSQDKRASDVIALREASELDAFVESVTLSEQGLKVNVTPRASDRVSLKTTGVYRGTLDQRDSAALTERRVLTRDVSASDAAGLTERTRLYRKTDFLDLNPDTYEERTGRLRSAASLIRGPDGTLHAAWLEGGQLTRATRTDPDSWRGHTRTATPAPAGARRVTLDFTPSPEFVTEVSGTLEWSSGRREAGVDPVNADGQVLYLTPDRRTLVTPLGPVRLGRRHYLRQSFTGGALLVDDLENTRVLGTPPTPDAATLDTPSARWRARPFTRAIIPVEGAVLNVERD